MKENLNQELFKGKKYSDLLEEIYNNQKKREKQVNTLISELKALIDDIGDATLVVPLIKEYLEIGTKNDEHLIKLAALIQKIQSMTAKSSDSGDDLGLTEEEIKQIQDSIDDLKSENKNGKK